MKKTLLLLALVWASVTTAMGKNALVVIAHGSPMPQWRQPVLNLESQLRTALKDVRGIDYIRVAMMEFTEPTIATVVSECEAAGVDSIFAIPLFIAPSGHSENDIPNILGYKFDPEVVAELKEENTRFVHSRLPITMGPTLAFDDFLEQTMTARVRELSQRPDDEAVLLVSHGDRQFIGVWYPKMESICRSIKDQLGIATSDYKFVAMGHKMVREMLPALQEMSKLKKRIIVQGVYLTSSAKEMADMLDIESVTREKLPAGVEVVYSDKSILPDSSAEVCQWIKKRTLEWLTQK